ncbi:MAG: hypothetical protein MJ085_05140 [Clostridia bacterium]|nr:hypothetical protein [Clostridia bacterium]
MTDKELKKLHRRDLLELLIQQTEDNEKLQSRVDLMNAQLQSRNINLSKAGSIAEAVIQVNEVFQKADKIAEQYLENVRLLSERQEETCARMELECQEKCDAMLEEAEKQCEAKKKEAEDFWASLSVRLDNFYKEHAGLREILAIKGNQI